MDDLSLRSSFQLGVAIGCLNGSDEKAAAAVGSTLDMLRLTLTKDTVEEFSVLPSANPADHFTPQQAVMVTRYALLPSGVNYSQCGHSPPRADTLPHGGQVPSRIQALPDGKRPSSLHFGCLIGKSNHGPWERKDLGLQRTEGLAYEMMSKWCENATAEGVQDILTQSTLILMPEIPHTQVSGQANGDGLLQLNCHDYDTVAPFENLLADVVKSVPQVDFLMLFALGGLKVNLLE